MGLLALTPSHHRALRWPMRLCIGLLIVLLGLTLSQAVVLAEGAILTFDPVTATHNVGDTFAVDLVVRDVIDLYTVDLRVAFYPAVVDVVDADPLTAGVQVGVGDIFASDTPMFNSVDNVTGMISYSIMGSSSGAFSGDGVIATITFTADAAGVTAFGFADMVLLDSGAGTITAVVQPGSITITDSGATATPTATATVTATATSVVTPTATLTPTMTITPTATLDVTATPTLSVTLTSTPEPRFTNTPQATDTPTMTSTPGTPVATNTPVFVNLPMVLKNQVGPTPTATTEPTLTATASTPTDAAPTGTLVPSTPTDSPTQTSTPTEAVSSTPTASPSITPTPSLTLTPSITPTASHTPVPTLTLTPRPTPTLTPTLGPGACLELILNGNCEVDEGWQFPINSSYRGGYSTLNHHGAGVRALRTGIEIGGPIYGYSTAEQTIQIPANADQITLSFWYNSQALGGYDDTRDQHWVLIVDQSGGYTTLMEIKWPASNAQVWTRAEFDETQLAAYKGQTVTLRFETFNNDWGNAAALYVDEVSLQVCDN